MPEYQGSFFDPRIIREKIDEIIAENGPGVVGFLVNLYDSDETANMAFELFSLGIEILTDWNNENEIGQKVLVDFWEQGLNETGVFIHVCENAVEYSRKRFVRNDEGLLDVEDVSFWDGMLRIDVEEDLEELHVILPRGFLTELINHPEAALAKLLFVSSIGFDHKNGLRDKKNSEERAWALTAQWLLDLWQKGYKLPVTKVGYTALCKYPFGLQMLEEKGNIRFQELKKQIDQCPIHKQVPVAMMLFDENRHGDEIRYWVHRLVVARGSYDKYCNLDIHKPVAEAVENEITEAGISDSEFDLIAELTKDVIFAWMEQGSEKN